MLPTNVLINLCFAALTVAQFEIDIERDTFLMNGEPFQYVSGSVHYFRMPRQYWRDRLRKMKAAGLNAVSTYVEWSYHEPEPGQFDFNGDKNITEFIATAEEEGLYVILRVGPYIDSERSLGGFPYWLYREDKNIVLRLSDKLYEGFVEKWLDEFFPIVEPLLFGNGGPIITVQVENEYGFSGNCDHNHTTWLAGVFRRHIQDKAVLFTNDGSDFENLSCGKIPGVQATLDVHPDANMTLMRDRLRVVEPHGPFADSEFYAGWVTHWGENWATKDTNQIVNGMKNLLDIGGNLNFYLFCGGSNFGFSAATNAGPFKAVVTSYDFDSPCTEAGDLTEKYMAIREFLLDYFSLNTSLPEQPTRGNYGVLHLQNIGRFASDLFIERLGNAYSSKYPLNFEAMNQDGGFVLYRTKSPVSGDDVILEADPRDLSHIYVNGNAVGTLSRELEQKSLSLNVKEGDEITILSENLGRICIGWGDNDLKGLVSNATFDGVVLENWTEIGYSFDNLEEVIADCIENPGVCMSGFGFSVYSGSFIANATSNIVYNGETFPADTFLDVSGLTKGLVFINGFNLGRYWSTRGPVYTLYVPGTILKPEPALNTVVVIDEEINIDSLSVPFTLNPIYGDPKP